MDRILAIPQENFCQPSFYNYCYGHRLCIQIYAFSYSPVLCYAIGSMGKLFWDESKVVDEQMLNVGEHNTRIYRVILQYIVDIVSYHYLSCVISHLY